MSSYKELKKQIQDKGIMCKGYGELPFLVLNEKNLTTTQKAIYTLLCSFKHKGKNIVFPKVKTILSALSITSNTYYKHIKGLEKLGFITISSDHKNKRNMFILEKIPTTYTEKSSSITNKVIRKGVNCLGTGYVSQAIMMMSELNITEKLIYALVTCKCSKDKRELSMPVSEICSTLGISNKTYSKAITNLTRVGVVSVVRIHENGRFRQNKYILNDELISKKIELSIIKSDKLSSIVPKNDCQKATQKTKKIDKIKAVVETNTISNNTDSDYICGSILYGTILDPTHFDTINNINLNNNIIINNNLSNNTRGFTSHLCDNDFFQKSNCGKLSSEKDKNYKKIICDKVKEFADWDSYEKNGYSNYECDKNFYKVNFDNYNNPQEIYEITINAITQLCLSADYYRVINFVNDLVEQTGSISAWVDMSIEKFAFSHSVVKNKAGYIKKCLKSSLDEWEF